MRTEDTAELLNENGIVTGAVRLTEDNFRYRYMDLSTDMTDALRANGLYYSDEHSYDEEEDFTDIEGWIVTENETKRVKALRIWKTPCGHARLWFLEAEDMFNIGSIMLISVGKSFMTFCDSAMDASKIVESVQNRSRAK